MLRSDIAARIGRRDMGPGSSVSNASSVTVDNSGSISGNVSAGVSTSGRTSLIILALITIGLVGYAYWTR